MGSDIVFQCSTLTPRSWKPARASVRAALVALPVHFLGLTEEFVRSIRQVNKAVGAFPAKEVRYAVPYRASDWKEITGMGKALFDSHWMQAHAG